VRFPTNAVILVLGDVTMFFVVDSGMPVMLDVKIEVSLGVDENLF
jgi:hypothetical protein